ncbi:MAG: gamma-glutamyltransferase family protein [Armatimonadetes bacterium]|nr:gamma-glutamyltransferase family protein [Armatimonadota bacterium]
MSQQRINDEHVFYAVHNMIARPPDTNHTYRPVIRGTHGAISAGHYLAAQAGYEILRAGGNAVDAGVAAGLVLNVVKPHMANLGGEAPIILYDPRRGEVLNIDGLGWWPAAATVEYFQRVHGGKLPPGGTAAGVVPAALDAWLVALARAGTMDVEDVFAPARHCAAEGFPVYEAYADYHAGLGEDFFRDQPTTAEVFAPGGRVPRPGEMLRQPKLAALLDVVMREARRHRHRGREAAIEAARDFFYRGEPAAAMARYCGQTGGLMTREDLAEYRVRCEPPVVARVWDHEVYVCGPWSQGPVIAQALRLMEGLDPARLPHNSPEYLHLVLETLKAAFADREAFYGDPQFVDVPMEALLSEAYVAERRAFVDPERAWPGLPPPGRPNGRRGWEQTAAAQEAGAAGGGGGGNGPAGASGAGDAAGDTTYLCVMDAAGTIFSSTPSGAGDLVPELGIAVSIRGRQSWLEEGHPSSVAPRKRPRLTPNPALVLRHGRPVMGLGTPGGDVQVQAMYQTLLNLLVFDMDAQEAVEVPRVVTYSMPISFYPHKANPGWIAVEESLPPETIAALERRGHRVRIWPKMPRKSSMCVVRRLANGVLEAGADIRGESYALGW